MSYNATKQHVANRGVPDDDFLDQLVAWGKAAPDEIFAPNAVSDVYTSVKNVLGPWQGIGHRRAAMLEVLRVLAGYESSWNWNQGRDTHGTPATAPLEEWETGAWQVSANSMVWGPELKQLVDRELGGHDAQRFLLGMKANHPLAMEYIARLLRRTVNANGPVKRHEIDHWLRRDAVEEFQSLLGAGGGGPVARGPAAGGGGGGGGTGSLHTPNGRAEIELMFGKPYNDDGTENETWYEQNIEKVAPPTGWKLYYQDDQQGLVQVSGIRIHKKLKDSFQSVLAAIWDRARTEAGASSNEQDIRDWLHIHRMDQHAGGYNFRNIHGTAHLSLHSYGIAIDWDADHNPQGSSHSSFPDWWYEAWSHLGWSDGRHFPTPDPMHVQFATGA